MAHWLFKSEPDAFSFADLLAAPDRSTAWDGVRNYQARNLLRDRVAVGDHVLFYHSNADPPAIAGVAVVARGPEPDPSAFDPDSPKYDPKSVPSAPRWYQVTIRAVRAIDPVLALTRLRATPGLNGMELLRKGSRLSVQPVTPDQWAIIGSLAQLEPPDVPD